MNEPKPTRCSALRPIALVWLWTLLLVVPPLGLAMSYRIAHPPSEPTWVTGDIDTGLIMEGLRNTKTFEDTLSWWTGPWVGIVPFYRPLTSYLFWFEWKAFGVNELAYLYPTVAVHTVATLMFASFAWAFAKWLRHPWPVAAGVLAGAAFSGIAGTPRVTVASLVYLLWKNQPDAAATFFGVGALWLYLLSIQARRGALAGAVAMYLAACGFKEIAVPLPVICFVMEPDLRFWKRPALDRIVAMGAAGGVFLLFRFLALRGMGYTYGSNDAAGPRSVIAILGPFGGITTGNWLVSAAAVTSAVVLYLAMRHYRRVAQQKESRPEQRWPIPMIWAAWGGGWLATLGWMGSVDVLLQGALKPGELLTLDGWLTGLLHLAINAYMNNVHLMVIALWLLVFLWRNCRRLLGFGFAWVAIMILPLTLSPGPVHRYYLPEGGYMLIAGLGLTWLAALLLERRVRTGQSPRTAIN